MFCEVCGKRHTEDPQVCREKTRTAIGKELSETFERLFKQYGDTGVVRIMIANYTVGYVGAAYGLHIPR
jgi:hypothetical protein